MSRGDFDVTSCVTWAGHEPLDFCSMALVSPYYAYIHYKNKCFDLYYVFQNTFKADIFIYTVSRACGGKKYVNIVPKNRRTE